MEGQFWALVLSLGGVSVVTGLLTEAFPFGASGAAKRGQAVVYSMALTFVWYAIGEVSVPAIVAPEFAGAAWAKFVLLAVASIVSAGVAMLGADGVQAVTARMKPKDGGS